MALILGSGSPRRLELLAQLGVVPDDVRPPDIDETPLPGERPRVYCERITNAKLLAVPAAPDDVILCGDTTVAVGRRILGKPDDAEQAKQFLKLLSGRRHRVITVIGIKCGDRVWHRTVVSAVKMKSVSDQELDEYIQSNDWQGKAGGYSIQGQASALIPWISGSYSAIVGLPLAETATLLRAAHVPVTLAGTT